MDVMMPVLDGYQATRPSGPWTGLTERRVPIVAMTANVFLEDIAKCRQAGMNDHLQRPLVWTGPCGPSPGIGKTKHNFQKMVKNWMESPGPA